MDKMKQLSPEEIQEMNSMKDLLLNLDIMESDEDLEMLQDEDLETMEDQHEEA
jgi:hypothetical protein